MQPGGKVKWPRKKGPLAKLEKVCSEREERSGNGEDETEDRCGAEGEDRA